MLPVIEGIVSWSWMEYGYEIKNYNRKSNVLPSSVFLCKTYAHHPFVIPLTSSFVRCVQGQGASTTEVQTHDSDWITNNYPFFRLSLWMMAGSNATIPAVQFHNRRSHLTSLTSSLDTLSQTLTLFQVNLFISFGYWHIFSVGYNLDLRNVWSHRSGVWKVLFRPCSLEPIRIPFSTGRSVERKKIALVS